MRSLSLLPLVLFACGGTPPAGGGAAASAAAGPTPADPAASTPVATWEGGTLTYGDLPPQARAEVKRMTVEYLQGRYDQEARAAESTALSALLELEAKAKGLSVEALLAAAVESQVREPTDGEVESFYPVVRRQLRNAPLEEVRGQVSEALKQQQRAELAQKYFDDLQRRYKYELVLPYPDLPRFDVAVDDDPSFGSPSARVTIVEFGEYQCPYCGRAAATMKEVRDTYGDKVRIVFRDFPLSGHDRAIPAALAANCAGAQGKYWEMHDLLLADQAALEDETLRSYAERLALDLGRWDACRQDPEQSQEILKDMQDGQAIGVSGTPAFFINGVPLSGARPFADFQRIIDKELDGAG